jgi:hypothetical protein
MKLAVLFALGVVLMLAVVVTGDQMVGISPATPEMSNSTRMARLDIVVAALGIVVCVNALFIWLAVKHPPRDEFVLEDPHDD